MSRSVHHQRPIGRPWNPPPIFGAADTPKELGNSVVSATECTGIEPSRAKDSEHKPIESK